MTYYEENEQIDQKLQNINFLAKEYEIKAKLDRPKKSFGLVITVSGEFERFHASHYSKLWLGSKIITISHAFEGVLLSTHPNNEQIEYKWLTEPTEEFSANCRYSYRKRTINKHEDN